MHRKDDLNLNKIYTPWPSLFLLIYLKVRKALNMMRCPKYKACTHCKIVWSHVSSLIRPILNYLNSMEINKVP